MTCEFVGSAILFLFKTEDALFSCYMKESGILVTREPDCEHREFAVWSEFADMYPEFAKKIQEESMRRMTETVEAMSKLQAESRLKEIVRDVSYG